MATHSSVLAWRIPGMAEPGGLPSMGSHRVSTLTRLSSSSSSKHDDQRRSRLITAGPPTMDPSGLGVKVLKLK